MQHFVNSPCGHGKLIDVVPYDGWDGNDEPVKPLGWPGPWPPENHRPRWGLIYVVQRRDGAARCCSDSEGEFETKAAAQEACDHLKRVADRGAREALQILDRTVSEAWSLARIHFSDLVKLREQLAEGRLVCSEALCFEHAMHYWLVDDEAEAALCEAHVTGRKVLDHQGLEVVHGA